MTDLDDLLARAEALTQEASQPGRDGRDGRDGHDGRDGVDGKDGAKGERGPAGKDGKDGRDGRDAARPRQYVFEVLRGPDGAISGLIATAGSD